MEGFLEEVVFEPESEKKSRHLSKTRREKEHPKQREQHLPRP